MSDELLYSPCDFYRIANESDNKSINQNRISLIYYTNHEYWLASATYYWDSIYLDAFIRCVTPSAVSTTSFFYSAGEFPYKNVACLRPIVILNADVTLSRVSDSIWQIN